VWLLKKLLIFNMKLNYLSIMPIFEQYLHSIWTVVHIQRRRHGGTWGTLLPQSHHFLPHYSSSTVDTTEAGLRPLPWAQWRTRRGAGIWWLVPAESKDVPPVRLLGNRPATGADGSGERLLPAPRILPGAPGRLAGLRLCPCTDFDVPVIKYFGYKYGGAEK